MAACDDWMGEEELEASRARSAAEGPLPEDPQLYADPEDTCSRPADLDDETLAAMESEAEADAAIEVAGVARGISAGFGYGYAHMPGMGPLPGSHSGPAAAFGQGMVLDTAPASVMLAAIAEDAAGAGRGFGGVNDDELMGLIGAQGRLEARHAWEMLMAVGEFTDGPFAGGPAGVGGVLPVVAGLLLACCGTCIVLGVAGGPELAHRWSRDRRRTRCRQFTAQRSLTLFSEVQDEYCGSGGYPGRANRLQGQAPRAPNSEVTTRVLVPMPCIRVPPH
jgi:hypothetical protein